MAKIGQSMRTKLGLLPEKKEEPMVPEIPVDLNNNEYVTIGIEKIKNQYCQVTLTVKNGTIIKEEKSILGSKAVAMERFKLAVSQVLLGAAQ